MQVPQDVVGQTFNRPFPEDIWRQLSGVDLKLLDEIAFLSRKRAERSRSGALYCAPGRKYLARKIGVAVSTISRHVSKLKRLGLLTALQRRPIGGIWQSNMYKINSWLGWRLAGIRDMVRKIGSRVAKKAHIALLRSKSISPRGESPIGPSGQAILKKWESRGQKGG